MKSSADFQALTAERHEMLPPKSRSLPVPRYFFHVMDGKAIIDDTGMELDSMHEVRHQAIRTAGEILSEGIASWSGVTWRMSVADESGTVVYSVEFSAADAPTRPVRAH
jgi:hypothetical protein